MRSVWIRRVVLALAVVLAVVSIVQVVRLAPVPAPPPEAEQTALPTAEAQPSAVVEPPRKAGWTVGVWQGLVAVFEGENTQPIQVLETPVSSLPEPDREALEAGIPVTDTEMLAGLLEDYGS